MRKINRIGKGVTYVGIALLLTVPAANELLDGTGLIIPPEWLDMLFAPAVVAASLILLIEGMVALFDEK